MGTSATAPVTAPEDALRRAREAVATVADGGPCRPAGIVEFPGTNCTAVSRGR